MAEAVGSDLRCKHAIDFLARLSNSDEQCNVHSHAWLDNWATTCQYIIELTSFQHLWDVSREADSLVICRSMKSCCQR